MLRLEKDELWLLSIGPGAYGNVLIQQRDDDPDAFDGDSLETRLALLDDVEQRATAAMQSAQQSDDAHSVLALTAEEARLMVDVVKWVHRDAQRRLEYGAWEDDTHLAAMRRDLEVAPGLIRKLSEHASAEPGTAA